jgi:peptidoglycan/xylan/chitin deacetylase (PgdA/CDA1 family)
MSRSGITTLCALAAAAAWAALTGGALRWIGLAALGALFVTIVALGVALPSWRFFGPFVCRGPADGMRVALTFDDGPDPQTTPAILDLLRDAGVPAAFFFIGERIDAHPDLAARAAREGHLLGNHSYRHGWATNFYTTARLVREIGRTQEAIARAAGAPTAFYRPPFGCSNPAVFRAVGRLGLRPIGWSARGLDKFRSSTSDRVVARIARRLAPGAIILLHDGDVPADRAVATLRALLDLLKASGYTAVRLDALLDDKPA